MKCFIIIACFVAVSSTKKNTIPECDPEMRTGCPKIFIPLCASNGKTYANLCELCAKSYSLGESNHANLTIEYTGECTVKGDEPLNGQSGDANAATVTIIPQSIIEKYPEPISVNCNKYNLAHGCSRLYMPLCGTNGETYGNHCTLCKAIAERGKNILIVRPNRCTPEDIASARGKDV